MGQYKDADVRPGGFDILNRSPQASCEGSDIVWVVRIVGGGSHVIVCTVIHDQDHIHLIHVHGFHYFHTFHISGLRFVSGNGGDSRKFVVAETFCHIVEIKVVSGIFRIVSGVFAGCGGIRKSAVINHRIRLLFDQGASRL